MSRLRTVQSVDPSRVLTRTPALVPVSFEPLSPTGCAKLNHVESFFCSRALRSRIGPVSTVRHQRQFLPTSFARRREYGSRWPTAPAFDVEAVKP